MIDVETHAASLAILSRRSSAAHARCLSGRMRSSNIADLSAFQARFGIFAVSNKIATMTGGLVIV
jgi:hypothetical protein